MGNEQKAIRIMNIADMTNPDTGKTYRQENLEKKHGILIGTLVEILGDEFSGMRLYVTEHTRDCDETPLYLLGSRTGQDKFGHFGRGSLKIVQSTD